MEQKIKKHMGLLYVALSAIFLFNPVIAFVDVLPDCFGYLLMCLGLIRLADLGDKLSDSLGRFRILLLISIGELFATYLIYGMMGDRLGEMNVYERPVYILLFSFVMLVVHWYFLIPAFRDLFLGINDLAERYGASTLTDERKNRTACERAVRTATVFVIVKSLMSVLPELSILTSFEKDAGNEAFRFDWYNFITLFRVIACAIALIASVAWLVSFLRLLVRALRESEWLSRLQARYREEILTQTGMLTVRRFSLSFLLLNVAVIFTVSLRLSGCSVLPSAVFALLALVALRNLGTLSPESEQCRALSWILTVVSLAQTVTNRLYLLRYYPEASLYQTDAYYHFLAVRVLGVAEALLTLLLIASLFGILLEIAKHHTEVDYGTQESAHLSRAATERLHADFEKRLKITFALFIAAAIGNAADAFLQLHVSWIWPIAFLLSFAAIWNFTSFLHELSVQIGYRYQPSDRYKRD